MRILYGVVGEGMGHATRSRVSIDHLRRRGCDVLVLASGHSLRMLGPLYPGRVLATDGIGLRHTLGSLDLGASIALNVQDLPGKLARSMLAMRTIDRFAPDLVVSDFDALASLWARSRGVPLVTVDNHQSIVRFDHPAAALRGIEPLVAASRRVVGLRSQGARHAVVTAFACPGVRPEFAPTTTVVPPIVREHVASAPPSGGDRVLVYQSSTSDPDLVRCLRDFRSVRFVVYGLGRAGSIGNVEFKPSDDDEFLRDLCAARAVVANGGMSLMGEAIYLGKPVFSVPIRRHPEQILNGRYLALAGYGACAERFSSAALADFFSRLPAFSARLAGRRQDGNRQLYDALDRIVIAEVQADGRACSPDTRH